MEIQVSSMLIKWKNNIVDWKEHVHDFSINTLQTTM